MIEKKSVLGMWVFLATEVLFFGALFVSFALNNFMHPLGFSNGVRHMNLFLGTANTAVLLTSSVLMAIGVLKASHRQPKMAFGFFIGTILLGFVFLGFKAVEYRDHFREHLVPGLDWHPRQPMDPSTELFFVFYFIMTLLHALHLLIGVSLVFIYGLRYRLSFVREKLLASLENVALYWHFVDLVWVFLFPCLYLIGRT